MKTHNQHADSLTIAPIPVKRSAEAILRRLRSVVEAEILRGGSQKALAPRLKVRQGTISNWMTDDGLDPSSSALGAICAELGVNGHWLLTGEGDRYTAPAGGGDALRRAGFEEGLGAAEAAIAALRAATAPAPKIEEGAFEPGPRKGRTKKDRPA